MKTLALGLALALAAPLALAQATPLGLWKTIDDETGAEKSQVRLTESAGVLAGRVERVLDPARQNAKCDKCSDERKDQPVLGLEIVRGAQKSAGDEAVWEGGTILDPNNGKVYRLRLKPLDGGRKLEVRGYIGPFYRNQVWVRVE